MFGAEMGAIWLNAYLEEMKLYREFIKPKKRKKVDCNVEKNSSVDNGPKTNKGLSG